jgi:aspartyl/glutamyl-tRNA(Asn/Gln) amidotransferase C subunit
MIHIHASELQSLARAARLTLPGNAQERLVNKLEAVLSYAELLATVEKPPITHQAYQQPPILRPDEPRAPIPQELLALAPHVEEHYFIVPVVIAGK